MNSSEFVKWLLKIAIYLHQFSSLAWLCWLFATPWTTACQASHGGVQHQLPEFTQTHVHWVSEAIQPSHPLFSPSPPTFNSANSPTIFPSIRVFSNESENLKLNEYWSFSFSITPSNEYSGLIFFRMDWLDLLAVQGTLKSLLQHHSLKTSVLWHSDFFMVQLSTSVHDYWKNHTFWLYGSLLAKWYLCILTHCLGLS